MHAFRLAQTIKMPSAPAHPISDFQRVDVGVLASESDNRGRRISEHIELRNVVCDSVRDGSRGSYDLAT